MAGEIGTMYTFFFRPESFPFADCSLIMRYLMKLSSRLATGCRHIHALSKKPDHFGAAAADTVKTLHP